MLRRGVGAETIGTRAWVAVRSFDTHRRARILHVQND
jgi:hypothetical protein